MDHSQAIMGGCQSLKCRSSAWAYWELLSSLGTPGNQPNRLATNSSAAITAIEVGLVAVDPTRDIALTTRPIVPPGMCLEICPAKRPAIRNVSDQAARSIGRSLGLAASVRRPRFERAAGPMRRRHGGCASV